MRRIAIGVVVAAMAVAACGGSSKKAAVASGGSSTTAGAGSASTAGGGGSGGNSDLSKLAGQYAKSKIKITYTSGTDASSTFTFAQDGNGKTAFSTAGGTVYSDGKTTVSCQGTGTAAKCIDSGSLGGGNLGATFTASFAAIAGVVSKLGGGDKSSESIAGRDASCVTYKAADVISRLKGLAIFKNSTDNSADYDPNDHATICIDKDTGFVVKVTGTKKGVAQDELLATAISEPSDSDFTPPVTPQTIPPISLPSGVSIPTP